MNRYEDPVYFSGVSKSSRIFVPNLFRGSISEVSGVHI